jgi:hypothetical protein
MERFADLLAECDHPNAANVLALTARWVYGYVECGDFEMTPVAGRRERYQEIATRLGPPTRDPPLGWPLAEQVRGTPLNFSVAEMVPQIFEALSKAFGPANLPVKFLRLTEEGQRFANCPSSISRATVGSVRG